MVDWTPDIAQLFGLVPDSWTPPAKARISAGRFHNTVSARFRTADGWTNTARVRIERRDGVLTVVDSSITQSFKISARGVSL
jgi:hypothetical protein